MILIFLNSSKPLEFFLQLVLNYRTITFKKRLNSNFAYGICVIFKNRKVAYVFLLTVKSSIIELYHLINKNQKLNSAFLLIRNILKCMHNSDIQ